MNKLFLEAIRFGVKLIHETVLNRNIIYNDDKKNRNDCSCCLKLKPKLQEKG